MIHLCAALCVASILAACTNDSATPTTQARLASTPAQKTADALRNEGAVAEVPASAQAFVESVGVVTHFHYLDTPYVTRYAKVRDLLVQAGIHHVRDTMQLDGWLPYYSRLKELANYGIHADTGVQMNESINDLQTFIKKTPNVVESIEAPNEWDLSGDPNWAADLLAYQKLLYAGIQGSPDLRAFPVIGPSLTSYQAYVESFPQGTFAQLANAGNIHDYFGTYNPGNTGFGDNFPPYGVYGTIGFWSGIASYLFAPLPIESTETGWDDGATSGWSFRSVSPAIKARYTMRVLLEHWNNGIMRTYLYELLDEGGSNFGNYGLLSGSLAIKPAYVALKILLSDLAGPNSPPDLKPLAYTLFVAGGATTVHHTLFRKPDGTYHLLLWNEVLAADPITQQEAVTISFVAPAKAITQLQWQDTGHTVTIAPTKISPNSYQVQITDRVSDIKISM